MKIILVGPAYPYRGGISHYNTRLFKALKERGHEVSVVNFKRMYPSMLFPGKTQYDESDKIFEVSSHRLIDSINPLSWAKTAKYIRSENPDSVIFHWWQPFFGPCYTYILKKIKNLTSKSVFICHNVRPHESSSIDTILSKSAFRNADRFLVHSEEDKVNLIDQYPTADPLKNFHPIYDIFEDRRIKPIESKSEKDDLPYRILFFGYVRKYKGLKYLLKALPKVLQDIDVILTIAGEFYEEKKYYLDLIQELGISKNVRITDKYIPNEEVSKYFTETDLVVIPYVNATQSGIVQISYNFGIPVVVTRVGGLPEVVWDGETGYIVEPKSSTAVADAILDYFKNLRFDHFRKNIIDRRYLFSWDNLVETLESLIR